MTQTIFRVSIVVTALCGLLFLAPPVEAAQSTAPAIAAPDQSVVVSPFLNEVQIAATDTSKDVSINLTNNTAAAQTYTIAVVDFGSLNESGGIAFAGNTDDKLVRKYGLANWLRLPRDRVSLKAGESTKIQATVVNETSLGPGGHYAALVVSIDNADAVGQQTVSVQQKISALLFATKVGGEVYDLKLTNIQKDGDWRQLPKIITLDFKNTGNVHVVPRGVVQLIAPGGKTISKGVINEASAYVLPETTRQFVVQTEPVSNQGWRPGTYTLRVDYRYDGYDTFASKLIAFRYNNLSGFGFIIVLLILTIYTGYRLRQRRARTAAPST